MNNKVEERIEINSEILVGKPIVKGTRLSVQYIVGLLGNGMSQQEILDEYPYLTQDDIRACLLFAEKILSSNSFYPLLQSA